MSMDPRILSQLLRIQLSSPPGLLSTSADESTAGNNDLFQLLLNSMLSSSDLETEGADKRFMTSSLDQPFIAAPGSSYLPHGLSGPSSYDTLINRAASQYQVDPLLIKAVIDQESSFNPYSVSSSGAKGLMQLMDGTAQDLGVTDSFDAEQNINGGTKYLAFLLQKYGGDEQIALAAYNAGPGRVDGIGITNRTELYAKYDQLPSETRAYIQRVTNKLSTYEL